jgi:hypothetical protein
MVSGDGTIGEPSPLTSFCEAEPSVRFNGAVHRDLESADKLRRDRGAEALGILVATVDEKRYAVVDLPDSDYSERLVQ